jgi:phosphoribosyl-ATP pyrophosphohydrolase/phosphoribosyl-AMP cyclohydrolase
MTPTDPAARLPTRLSASSLAPLLAAATFDDAGLVPVIAQEAATGMIRMFAWANREALARTVETGHAHFWSRSRQALWRKGETSGNRLAVRELRLDCDGDVVLYLVDAEGPSCHTGRTSCFFRRADATSLVEDDGPPDPPAVIIARVSAIIARRRRERPEKSYVVSLLDAGWPKILGKILEESGELVDALTEGHRDNVAHEAADVLFHVLVGLEAAGVSVDDVFAQLRKRFGVSGIDEKASRVPATATATAAATVEATAPLAGDASGPVAAGVNPEPGRKR